MALQQTHTDPYCPFSGRLDAQVDRWLQSGMRPAPVDLDALPPDLPLGRRIRLGALIAALATGCYAAVACGIAVFLIGAVLTTQNVARSLVAERERPAEVAAPGMLVPMPSQDEISRDQRRGTNANW